MGTQQIVRACRNSIGDAVRRSAARGPEKVALIFGERRWSYAELDAGANRVANALLAQGLEKGDRVAAYLRRGTVLVVGGHPVDGGSGDENRGAER